MQHGGWCAASLTAAKTFNKYGKSSACKPDGKGGPWANQVYVIKGNYARSKFFYTHSFLSDVNDSYKKLEKLQ